ncbi:hypothetical protein ON010_g12538 [Phytophthora cinnamomi]|nr:hypothetical protein ON010_g12538 [Phytophthora cinnamomi]
MGSLEEDVDDSIYEPGDRAVVLGDSGSGRAAGKPRTRNGVAHLQFRLRQPRQAQPAKGEPKYVPLREGRTFRAPSSRTHRSSVELAEGIISYSEPYDEQRHVLAHRHGPLRRNQAHRGRYVTAQCIWVAVVNHELLARYLIALQIRHVGRAGPCPTKLPHPVQYRHR